MLKVQKQKLEVTKRVISCEASQPIWPQIINDTDGQPT